MAADQEIALIIGFVNFCSAIWSYFCIIASLDRCSRAYELVHETELVWNAFWSSCQTFALLVSVTNFVLVIFVACRAWSSFVGKFKSAPGLSQKAAVGLLGAALLLLLLPASFIPFNLTRISTSRLDENVFIHWDG
ncbi:hypothetical protein Q9L58_005550 [Maublancomyces gigas]|uniref:Uncharacterized protein n=1 Tax=Discina gigas TaxID=1032678 RepID=A0ABR3GIA1_9PEZI